jgi:hypothetical protein
MMSVLMNLLWLFFGAYIATSGGVLMPKKANNAGSSSYVWSK